MVLLLVLVLGGALVLFAYQNPVTITVNFGYWTWSGVPIWYPAVAAALAGLFIALVWTAGVRSRSRRERRSIRDAGAGQDAVLAEHEAAIDDLRWKTRWLEEEVTRRPGASV